MRLIRLLLLAAVVILLGIPNQARAAVQGGNCEALPAFEWREARTRFYTILYPVEFEALGQALATQVGEALDQEYARFEALFGGPLALPVTLRVYPTVEAFACLNSQAAEIPEWTVHSHVGAREIALIGRSILADVPTWSQNYVNDIRYELGVLFAEHGSGGRAPPGLLVALGHYVQDPARTVGELQLDRNDWQAPDLDWRSLWQAVEIDQAFADRLQATSTVAYLVDLYGWTAFNTFLQSLPTSQNYREALSRVYGKSLAELEKEWREYYPLYYQGRWQVHLLYNYDLSFHEALILEEKYAEAGRKLQEAIPLLEKLNQPEKLEWARMLFQAAQTGHEAADLAGRSRQAFASGDYQGALALADQAAEKYAEIQNEPRIAELTIHRDQIRQTLALHEELAHLQGEARASWNIFSLAARLVALGRRLSALGDVQGYARAQELARLVEARQRAQQYRLGAAIFTLLLAFAGVHLWLLRRKPPLEAQL